MIVDFALALAAKRSNWQSLFRHRHVVGVGVGYKNTATGSTDEPAVVVHVTRKLPSARLSLSDLLPSRLGEVRTDVIEVGEMQAQRVRRRRLRPFIPPGVSLGHLDVTSGTFGCLVQREGEVYLLSNNHVLANANRAIRGAPIIQPGRYDGGNRDDIVAYLADFVPLIYAQTPPGLARDERQSRLAQLADQLVRFVPRPAARSSQFQPALNYVDAAIAKPVNPRMFTPTIVDIGVPRGIRKATLGQLVRKSGRTSGYTEGRILQFDVTTSVRYHKRRAMFAGQLLASPMSQGGDSGAAVVDADNYLIGQIFAGSHRGTLITPIALIFQALQVELYPAAETLRGTKGRSKSVNAPVSIQ